VSLRFHSRFDARSKLYRYTIATGGPVSPFVRHFAGRCPCRLDIKAMKKAAGILVGRHDFRSFQAKAAGGKSSVRAIHYIRLENSENMVYIYINADGFLYNMARNIAGTLIKVGRGRISPGSVRDILSRKDRRSGGPTAPAKGLCLLKVAY
jgi:tRNA pseudouridine38-40 synthase